jgi:hypothetical protein
LAGNTATDRTATGIDYLRILDDARGDHLAQQINYAALFPDPDAHDDPGQGSEGRTQP